MSKDQKEFLEIEKEQAEAVFEKNNGYLSTPFSTKDIKITPVIMALSMIIERLRYDEIDLNPDFQRNKNLWNKQKMSSLVESVLLKLPLPAFYFDVSNPGKWIVVDGLQRLSTFKKFVVDNDLKLSKLEFLTQFENTYYKNLDRPFKRIIDETQIVTYQIEAQTPKEVRYSIFRRINTGGLILNAQEIRQALNQKGKAVAFLKKVTEDPFFIEHIKAAPDRMANRELFLRFIAFKFFPYHTYNAKSMALFLDMAMEKLDKVQEEQELISLKDSLFKALDLSALVLGKHHGFSRSVFLQDQTKVFNHSLFDIITVCFSEIKNVNLFVEKKDYFIERLSGLIKDTQSNFSKSITKSTSSKNAVITRFSIMESLIKETLNA